MNDQVLTAGAWRALELAARLAREVESPRVEPLHLLWALLVDESRGAELLAECGLGRGALRGLCPVEPGTLERLSGETGSRAVGAAPASAAGSDEHADLLAEALLAARRRAARANVEVGSEHLLWGLVVTDSPVATVLRQVGLGAEALGRRMDDAAAVGEPIPTDVRLAGSGGRDVLERRNEVDVLRVLDAAGNRAREGLRVLEDYVRFVLDDAHLMRLLKEARHELSAVLADCSPPLPDGTTLPRLGVSTRLVAARDTPGDVGTEVHTASEAARGSLSDVVIANFRRVEEAARTLEEFGKLVSPGMGEALGRLRYRLYSLEKAVALTRSNRERLDGCRLYLLVTQSLCWRGLETVVREALAGGVDAVQLREKELGDRELVALGRQVREWTREAGALFLMNDRPDLAVLCDADGVHVGQDELTVRDARRIVGPDRLVGVSTHTIEQARQAVLDGADYLGVGPVFPSATKTFDALAGVEFVRQVANEIALPWFAIGGITAGNVRDVPEAGTSRIAVSGAICGAEDACDSAEALARLLLRGSSLETNGMR